jgi:putative NAD(P)-binding protein/flavin-dependent amine oxidoreductase
VATLKNQPGINRRDLLKTMGAAVAVSTLEQTSTTAILQGESDFDCIVLGAGMAGATAAHYINQGDASKRVLVLEASDRVGGRMYSTDRFVQPYGNAATVDPSAYPIEYGAEYVHVGNTGPYKRFWDDLEKCGLGGFRLYKFHPLRTGRTRIAFPPARPQPSRAAVFSDQDIPPSTCLLVEVDHFNVQAADQGADHFITALRYRGRGRALARYTMSAHTPGRLFDPNDPFDRKLQEKCHFRADRADTISVLGFKLDAIPHQLIGEDSEYRVIKSGRPRTRARYDTFPRKMLERVSGYGEYDARTPGMTEAVKRDRRPVTLLKNFRVTRVHPSDGGILIEGEVREADGKPGTSVSFAARSAVCTFSVGVIDPDHRYTGPAPEVKYPKCDFGPYLKSKLAALQVIKMGPITSFTLQFKKCVWGGKAAMSMVSHSTGCGRTFFSVFPGERRGPFVLTGLLMNNDHLIIRELFEHDGREPGKQYRAITHVLKVLHEVYGKPGTEPWQASEVLVEVSGSKEGARNYAVDFHDWERDEFTQGANSFLSLQPGGKTDLVKTARETLRSPTLPLFWAGEATAPAYDPRYQPLSVHGAYISGVEVAYDVLDYLRRAGPLGYDVRRVSLEYLAAYHARYRQRQRAAREDRMLAGMTVSVPVGELSAVRGRRELSGAADPHEILCRIIALARVEPLSEADLREAEGPAGPLQLIEIGGVEYMILRDVADRFTGGDLERALRSIIRHWARKGRARNQ